MSEARGAATGVAGQAAGGRRKAEGGRRKAEGGRRTVRSAHSTSCCGHTPMCFRMALMSEEMSCPNTAALPAVGGKRPVNMDNVVLMGAVGREK